MVRPYCWRCPILESQDMGESSWYSILETLSLLSSFHCAVKFYAHCQGRKATSSLNQLWTEWTAWISGLTRQTNRHNSGMDVIGVINNFLLRNWPYSPWCFGWARRQPYVNPEILAWLDFLFSERLCSKQESCSSMMRGWHFLPCIRICLGYLFIHFIPTSCAHQQPFWYVNTYLSFVFH